MTSDRKHWKIPGPALAMAFVIAVASVPARAQTGATANAATAASTPTQDPVARIGELSRIRREAGLKICRDSADGKLTYQGFVQDSEQGNIKITIAAEIDKASGQPVDGFQPVNVWDPIEHWRVCPK